MNQLWFCAPGVPSVLVDRTASVARNELRRLGLVVDSVT